MELQGKTTPGYALVITYSYHLILINFLCETNFEKLCLASSNFSQGNPKYHLKNEICGSKSRVSTKWFSVKDGSGRKFCETKWRWYPENLSVLLRTVAFSHLNLYWCFLSMPNTDFSSLGYHPNFTLYFVLNGRKVFLSMSSWKGVLAATSG